MQLFQKKKLKKMEQNFYSSLSVRAGRVHKFLTSDASVDSPSEPKKENCF